jgi:hypothetical protein
MIRRATTWRLVLATVGLAASASAQGPISPKADSAFARARQLVAEGNGAAGRVLVDSVLQSVKAGTPTHIEGLWWRAVLGETAAATERDLLRIAIEHPGSPRAPEALLRLVQLEASRGARDAALRHLDRLTSEHPDSPLLTQGYYWRGKVLLDAGTRAEGCAALATARSRTAPSNIELRNQIDFLAQRCDSSVGVIEPTPERAPAVPAPAAAAPPRVTPSTASAARFRVAAGTFSTRAKATSQLRKIEAKGFEGRVGTAGPGKFRVFVGESMVRADASALVARLAKAGLRGATVLQDTP